MAKNDIPKSVKCSFCGKTQDNVRKIIAGPGVYICNECVGLCNEIIDAEYSDEDTYTLAELDEIPSPKEIKKVLDARVIEIYKSDNLQLLGVLFASKNVKEFFQTYDKLILLSK